MDPDGRDSVGFDIYSNAFYNIGLVGGLGESYFDNLMNSLFPELLRLLFGWYSFENLSLKITFGHGARHLIGTGLSSDVVEAAMRADVTSAVSEASATEILGHCGCGRSKYRVQGLYDQQ